MAKRVLVTGAAGFIGSHVAQRFLERGDFVVGLDNFNDYYDPARKRANVAEVRAAVPGAEFRLIEGDIRDRALLKQLFSDHAFDAVVHLAAMAGVRASQDDPHLYLDVNLTGTLNLLDASRDHGRPNFVFASTSSAYGATSVIPFVETDPSDRPLAPYPASKRAAELLGYSYHHLYKLDFTAVRFFTVYGPRGRPDMMAYKVLDNIFFDRSVPLFNEGKMHRDWTFVSDIADGVVRAADRRIGYEIVNLGRGEPVLVAEFVDQLQALVGKRAKLVPAPMADADVAFTFADVSKARRLLGYEPKVSVAEGVASFWAWYREHVLAGGRR